MRRGWGACGGDLALFSPAGARRGSGDRDLDIRWVNAEQLGEAAAEPKKPNLLARARSWLAASVDEVELDGPEDRIAVEPTDDDVSKCLALVPEAFAKHPSAEAWARQALIVQRGNVEYAAKKLTKLAEFRDRYGWAYRLDVDDGVA